MNNLIAKGGGCFLPGTLISTSYGHIRVEDIEPGDEIISYNEDTKQNEVSVVGSLDIIEAYNYYVINGDLKVTGSHPFYTSEGIMSAESIYDNFDTIKLYDGLHNEVVIDSMIKYQRLNSFNVYNILDVAPNHNYYANGILVHNKGGGCFLADTLIETPNGTTYIQDIKSGDKITSLNEVSDIIQTSTVERLEVLGAREYYEIETRNGSVDTTGEHPFYILIVDTMTRIIRNVSELRVGDYLVTGQDSYEKIISIQKHVKDVVIYNLINVTPNHNYFANGYLVHNKGSSSGGRASSSAKSSTSSSKSSTSSSSSAKTSVKAGSSVKTSTGATVKTTTKTPTSSKFKGSTAQGVTGVDDYAPKFKNNYTAPAGSMVYYPQHSFTDYLPWIYLFSQNSPAHDTTTIMQPDGKEVVAMPEKGNDGMAVFNWILLIVFVIAIIGGIVWCVDKATVSKEEKERRKRNKDLYRW